ncbi:MAG: hypothetical protein JXR25_06085 [Pontiellaceae bacterium]|nr:hypothetical protein [Pontiellaceae bacterium]MBN2784377.1 hypothetical protein [Pontiellaceae bacterium]
MNRPILVSLLSACSLTAAQAQNTTFTLARELLNEEQYSLAAIEFRRAAMESEAPDQQAASYLFAGYAYLNARQPDFTGEMLDRAEEADQSSRYRCENTLLNAENAYAARDTDMALYYYDLLAEEPEAAGFRQFALRRAAAIDLGHRDWQAARRRLEPLGDAATLQLEAIDAYAAGQDKSPALGGLLGLIPGLGYWYSGETANGFRSLILNSLFMYGMADTADDDEWGAFAIITFFEVTWYSGSIYGGIDAAQRYNQERLANALDVIEGDMGYRPDSSTVVPLFKLNLEF